MDFLGMWWMWFRSEMLGEEELLKENPEWVFSALYDKQITRKTGDGWISRMWYIHMKKYHECDIFVWRNTWIDK